MPSPFADFALPADLTGQFYPVRPGTGRRLTDAEGRVCVIEMRGWHSKAAQDYRFAREEKLRKLGREFSPQEAYDDLGDMLAVLTASWVLVAPTGRHIDLPCTFDNARALYNDIDQRWLRQQAVDFLNTEGNFVPPGWID